MAEGLHLKWPESYATVYQDALPVPLLAQLYQDAKGVADCPNFWTPTEALVEGGSGLLTTAEQVVAELYQGVVRNRLPGTCAGAEWWVQVYQPGKGLAFHFDKDEDAFKDAKAMHHPILSSVLYLTGNAVEPRLGPTVIVDQQYDSEAGEALPEFPSRSALVYPVRNQYCIFDGRLGHGVLDSCAKGERVTLLVNWWAQRPQSILRITAEQASQFRLSLPTEPAASTTASPSADFAPQQQVQPDTNGNADGSLSSKKAAPVSPADTAGTGSAGGSAAEQTSAASAPHTQNSQPSNGLSHECLDAHPTPRLVSTAVITMRQDEEQFTTTVDDLLHSYNVQLTGNDAVHAVAIDHEGYLLYPLGDQLEGMEEPIMTAAALVPAAVMDATSSDSSESSDEDEA